MVKKYKCKCGHVISYNLSDAGYFVPCRGCGRNYYVNNQGGIE